MPAPRLAEQFADLGTQGAAARLGMWIFLASELLLFAGLFTLYGAYRAMYPAAFAAATTHNDIVIGSVNTIVLITSSLTVAMAVHATKTDRPRRAASLLGATVVLGLVFLALKATEYADHFRHGILPGAAYRFTELPEHGARVFFTLYYAATGLHAVHVTAGLAALVWLATGCARRRYGAAHHVPVELGGLYWHLVDLVWIFLWPLLYLAR